MKRLLFLLILILSFVQANAVLKEKDLPHTLGVLKEELKADFEKQKIMMQRYESMNAEQHAQLISYMKRSEQIGLILFSQKNDFTFDMAYACQEATKMYRELKFNTLPYDRIQTRVNQEIERYTELIALLKAMPPAIGEAKDSLTAIDSLALQEADSLAELNITPKSTFVKEEITNEPFLLEGNELQNRQECLYYAEEMLANLKAFIENITQEQIYYDQVAERAQKLNEFAQSRYKILQQNIFKDGTSNYLALLMKLPLQIMLIKNDIVNKYKPLAKDGTGVSEWRGFYVVFISIFMIFYIALSILLSNIIMRWLMPKRFRTPQFKMKRQMFINVLGVALFAIFTMVARCFTDRNIVLMATSLMATFAWLIEVIFLSLLIRLDGAQMKDGAKVYMPFIFMAMVVILFRIILIPNSLVNLIYPPILFCFTIWQSRILKHHKDTLPPSDKFYSSISLLAMITASIASFVGYTLFAVEIMMWWMFQLTAIQTITCLFDLLKMYEHKKLIYKLEPSLHDDIKEGRDIKDKISELVERIKKGKFISQTWVFDFIHLALVPILGVLSVLMSIFYAADIFDMTSVCEKIFITNFIEQEGVCSISLFKICLVASLWFLFKYFNYALTALYHHVRRRTLGDSKEDYNGTLANNVITILVWGGYCIFALVLLQVPKDGISVVAAGLATGMGFAMKDLLENFFYGISLMSGRVRVGDYIECDGIRGKVEKITYQSTMIITMDGCVIAFLNSALFSKNFKNLTRNHQYELVKIPVGVAYGSNVNEVRQMLINALTPICNETTESGKQITDENTSVTVAFSGFGDNSVDLLVCIWMLVEKSAPFTGRCKEIIYNTLNDNNINIPFPQRDLYVHQIPDINVKTK